MGSAMAASGMAMSTRQTIRMDMEKFNNDAMCWGVENMMAYRLAQYKAMDECSKYGQFGTLPGDASNPWMNVPQPVDSRRSPLSKLFNRGSNSKMDMLDSSLQVNLKLWTTDIWQQINLKKTLAGEDPEWRQKLIGGYTDCYQVASNWPQQSLDRNPITKVF